MADVLSPEVFSDTGAGRAVNAARLNNHVNGLAILAAFVSAKANVTPLVTDRALLYKSLGNVLIAPPLSSILALVPADPVAATPGTRTLGTGAQQAASGTDTRIVGAMQKASNLSDIPNRALARTTLEVGHRTAVPATSTSTGTAGDLATDASFIYVCTATNTWKRVALVTF